MNPSEIDRHPGRSSRRTLTSRAVFGILMVLAFSLLVSEAARASSPGDSNADRKNAIFGQNSPSFHEPVLTGKMTLIGDDCPSDTDGVTGNPVLTVLLDLEYKGQHYLIAKSLQNNASQPCGANPGDGPGTWVSGFGWNQETSGIEGWIDLFLLGPFVWEYQPPVGPLEDLGTAILEVAQTALNTSNNSPFDLNGKWPMIRATRESPTPDQDQFTGTDLAKVFTFDVRIDFVDSFTPPALPTPTPGPSPTPCS